MSNRRAVPAPQTQQPTNDRIGAALHAFGLPENAEAERAVLGACLLDNGTSFDVICDKITAQDFHVVANQRLWSAFVRMRGTNPPTPIDFGLLVEALRRTVELEAVGGVTYLSTLTDGLPRSVNIEHYAAIVREKAQRRMIATRLGAIVDEALRPGGRDTPELIDAAGEIVDVIGHSRDSGDLLSLVDVFVREWNDLSAFVTPAATRRGISTGFPAFDDLTSGGLHPGQLIVVGARPGMGKTTALLDMSREIGRHRNVLIFNQEMTARELFERLVCQQGDISLRRLRAGTLNRQELERAADAVGYVNGLSIHLDESPSITIAECRTRARRFRNQHGNIGMIGIDYLQLLTAPKAENRHNEISEMTRGCKTLARELDCPVVLLSQLTRESGKSGVGDEAPRPQLVHLRDSGSIEADADLVMFVHRPEYWMRQMGRIVPEDQRGKGVFIIAKQRNGPTEDVPVAFMAPYVSFRPICDATARRRTGEE